MRSDEMILLLLNTCKKTRDDWDSLICRLPSIPTRHSHTKHARFSRNSITRPNRSITSYVWASLKNLNFPHFTPPPHPPPPLSMCIYVSIYLFLTKKVKIYQSDR